MCNPWNQRPPWVRHVRVELPILWRRLPAWFRPWAPHVPCCGCRSNSPTRRIRAPFVVPFGFFDAARSPRACSRTTPPPCLHVWHPWQVLLVAAVQLDVPPEEVESFPQLLNTGHVQDIWFAYVADPYAADLVGVSANDLKWLAVDYKPHVSTAQDGIKA